MLHEFLAKNRGALIVRCRDMVAQRRAPRPSAEELEHGIPLFLDQLIRTLRSEEARDMPLSRAISGRAGGGERAEIGDTAALHGRELLLHGFTADQVVHVYGDLCQAITDSAFGAETSIEVDEFRTLNRCLDNAIADAVNGFGAERDALIADRDAQTLNERLGFFAHELRNLIQTATLALTAIKVGNVGLAGATGAVLDRSLIGLRTLVDRSLADVRVKAGLPPRQEEIPLAEFIAETKISACLEAQARQCSLTVASVDPALAVLGDRDLLSSAVGNLLDNAFKYTRPRSEVTLRAHASADRIFIEVEDQCGGLHPGDAERMMVPFTHLGEDLSGLGLGLSICKRSVEANDGALTVRNLPGAGCVFAIALPRHALAPWPI
ncbi:MAG TPA: HAMP domain-containing sensor histidine kinase [Burkholderiales bacterium]|nr:HAMP domain-containing sensor histidine kinase [Burkholderiales bacterium]